MPPEICGAQQKLEEARTTPGQSMNSLQPQAADGRTRLCTLSEILPRTFKLLFQELLSMAPETCMARHTRAARTMREEFLNCRQRRVEAGPRRSFIISTAMTG